MQNVFDKFEDVESKIDPDITYSEAIYLCTSIRLDSTEDESTAGLSQWICDECLGELRIAISFRAKCEETDAVLRRQLNEDGQFLVMKREQVQDIVLEEVECCDDQHEKNDDEMNESSTHYLEESNEVKQDPSLVVSTKVESFKRLSHYILCVFRWLRTHKSMAMQQKDILYLTTSRIFQLFARII